MSGRAAGARRRWAGFREAHPRIAGLLAPPLRAAWKVGRWLRPSPAPSPSQGTQPAASMVDQTPADAPGPRVVADQASLVAAGIEFVYLVPGEGVFVVGWLFDPLEHVVSLRALTTGSASDNVLRDLERRLRPDVREAHLAWTRAPEQRGYGIAGLVHIPGAMRGHLTSSLRFELADGDGRTWTIGSPAVLHDPASPLATIAEILDRCPARDVEQLDRHLGPTIAALWGSRPDRPADERVSELGAVNAAPVASIVVPVLERPDLISYVLALLADHPDVRDAELVFVLADAATAPDAVLQSRRTQPLYGLPCRLVSPARTLDAAGAINAGVRAANAPVLVLLDPHVLPAGPGWLSGLLDAYANLPGPGAVGPRLLRNDGSLHSDGAAFADDRSVPGLWVTEHPGRGLPPGPASSTPRPVAALSGSCMVMSRELFQRVGGLDEGYLRGHYADADLCLKLRQVGCVSHVVQEVTMTSIDAPAAPDDAGAWHDSVRIYDAWRLNRRWESDLARLAEEPSLA